MCFSLHPHQRQVKGVSETSGDEAQGALTNVSFFLTKFFSILFGNNDTYITAYGNYLVSEVTKMRFWFYSSLLYVQCVILIKSKKCFILIFFLSPRVYFSADVVCVNDVGAALPFSCPFISPQITLYNFDHKKKHIFYIFFFGTWIQCPCTAY